MTFPPTSDRGLQLSLPRPCAGSPLGLFLALRRVNPKKGRGLGTPAATALMLGSADKAGDGLPAVSRMYNLYHPFDPVAYRWAAPAEPFFVLQYR